MSFSNKKKQQGQGGGGNNRKQRFGGGGNGGNRPRKNYGAMREKYLQQARDAMAMGDRVLAENYYQHADHCFRMMAEDAANRPPRPQPSKTPNQEQGQEEPQTEVAEGVVESVEPEEQLDDSIDLNVSSLPAFLTSNYTPPKKEDAPAPAQNWEEE